MVTCSRLRYQDLRGLTRSLSLASPSSRSQVHLTSAAVKDLPSCHLTPWRKEKVSAVPSSFHDHAVARSATIVSGRFCATCWSYMTRLLKMPMAGRSAAPVASSCNDTLAGLSKNEIFRTPPVFCADAVVVAQSASSNRLAAARFRKVRFMTCPPTVRGRGPIDRSRDHAVFIVYANAAALPVQPDV